MGIVKIGDYVRTDDGIISKIISILDEYIFIEDKKNYYYGNLVEKSKINKSSPNIIDLIEVGDYVNGLPVRYVEENRVDIGQEEDFLWLKNEHITSILTKEQFESMEYRIGGK